MTLACPCRKTAAQPLSGVLGRGLCVPPAAGSERVEWALALRCFSLDLSCLLQRGGCGGRRCAGCEPGLLPSRVVRPQAAQGSSEVLISLCAKSCFWGCYENQNAFGWLAGPPCSEMVGVLGIALSLYVGVAALNQGCFSLLLCTPRFPFIP